MDCRRPCHFCLLASRKSCCRSISFWRRDGFSASVAGDGDQSAVFIAPYATVCSDYSGSHSFRMAWSRIDAPAALGTNIEPEG